MNAQLSSPVTQDNFQDAWKYTDEQRRTAKRKALCGRIAGFFSHMVFSALLLIAGCGLIHDHIPGACADFLETLPGLIPLWAKYRNLVLGSMEQWYLQAAVTALVIYGVSFLVNGLVVLAAGLIYHPRRREAPALTDKENAQAHLELAKEARGHAKNTECGSSAFCMFLFALTCYVLVVLYGLQLDDFMELIDILSGFLLHNMVLNLMILSLGLYLAYSFLDTIHAKTVQPLVAHAVPYSYLAQLEHDYIFCGENPEEASADLSQLLDQALEFERMGAVNKANELIARAAHGGNAEAMEHYARHFMVKFRKEPTRYWLQRCVDTGEASETAVKNLQRLKWHRKVEARYLK